MLGYPCCRFAELAKLVDPGSEPKTDKTTILVDTIRYVQQMTVESHQLKQLNKFLEVGVSVRGESAPFGATPHTLGMCFAPEADQLRRSARQL